MFNFYGDNTLVWRWYWCRFVLYSDPNFKLHFRSWKNLPADIQATILHIQAKSDVRWVNKFLKG